MKNAIYKKSKYLAACAVAGALVLAGALPAAEQSRPKAGAAGRKSTCWREFAVASTEPETLGTGTSVGE